MIESRKTEDTWQVDSFGGVPVKSRTPDEVVLFFFLVGIFSDIRYATQAIMLCLDLSESMNQKSAVSDSRFAAAMEEEEFDPETEAKMVIKELLNGYSDSFILDRGRSR